MILTLESVSIVRKAWLTVSDVALPPVSRKLAGDPPRFLRASTVFIARPAPFTARCWRGTGTLGERMIYREFPDCYPLGT